MMKKELHIITPESKWRTKKHAGLTPMARNWVYAVGIFCTFVVCLVFWKSNQHGTVILKVETIPAQKSILELQRIIEAQKKTIDMYAKRPKVVFRCLDDEPKLKYPRHPSDNYTVVTMGTNDECGNTFELDAVVLVHSATYNFEHRERFRRMYSNQTATKPYKLKVVFLIGQVEDANLQLKLELENREFGDTIQGNFIDTYQNLTLKAVMGYRWVTETCQNVKLLLKVDDDVSFDVHTFFGEYWHKLRKDKKVRRISCQYWRNAVVNRKGKWRVEKGLFRNATYDFPYCSGFFVVITADIIKEMYLAARKDDFFWIDDVFMYGMVPHTMKTVGFTQLGGKAFLVTQSKSVYDKCYQKKGVDCSYLAVVTGNGDETLEVYNKFRHQVLLNKNAQLTTQKLEPPKGKTPAIQILKQEKPASSDNEKS